MTPRGVVFSHNRARVNGLFFVSGLMQHHHLLGEESGERRIRASVGPVHLGASVRGQ